MTTELHILLPEALKAYVKERVEEKRYGTPSDYIQALVREDQRRREEEQLEQMLLRGIESGKKSRMSKKEIDAMCRDLRDRLRKRSTE
jgi:antitoxin ParD1/3/4